MDPMLAIILGFIAFIGAPVALLTGHLEPLLGGIGALILYAVVVLLVDRQP